MKFTGDAVLHAPVERVWDSILDPAVLVQTIPGCERLVATGDNSYDMTVTAGVASIKGTYTGSCVLSDLNPHRSLVMTVEGAGAPGTLTATVDVGFADVGDGTTRLSYDADAVVGGMVGGVGQRMLTSVSKRMAGDFFGSVDSVLSGAAPIGVGAVGGPAAVAGAEVPAGPGAVFTPPARPVGAVAPISSDFLTGLAVGAGLVVLGVIVGGIFGRRR
ncbi:MAG: carbon monoxide dehydrogenase subunit G [Nocardioides sp.]